MIAISRFTVPADREQEFATRAEAAVAVLSGAVGFLTADVGRNLDEPTLWTITTRWQNVGSYRRALGSYQAKLTVVPMLSLAIDEPSAYESPQQMEL
ncbi:antibiotic biosynthesis monooxygenase [Microlunatus sp. Gsoil 973]|uniref:antibiotic biosynthesis monooxygenase family protein n=1 Tax=Microlunatus sp. Gsoil 973 TaxID=2672569 RepID=UPI0012B4FA62|nr:antibiotic biosynthesis monooxygenase family protein [Microlunatus sp. Gsoil 973]QGN31799.1 antibiotic biosynthesis monooxygenase [Microlunatus sp. Gsoil 973]